MTKIELPTYKAEITVGLREGYSGPVHEVSEAKAICQYLCNEIGLCVEFSLATCIYASGNEPCVHVTLINYPRFSKQPAEILETAEELGLRLATAFKQQRFSIVATDKTIMIELM